MSSGSGESIHFWQTPPLAGVELLSARYIEQRFVPHVHDGFVIGMIVSGAQRYRYRGADHLAPSGTLVLINPDEVHTGSKGHDQGWLYRAFYPQNARLESLLQELDIVTSATPSFSDTLYRDNDLVAGFYHLHRVLENGGQALEQQTLWREMTLALFSRHAKVRAALEAGREPRAIARAKELLMTHLAEPPSLEALAQSVNLSPFHFARCFRKATGLPPHAWLMQQRISRARALLREGCLPLAVATQLGFADQSHLSRQFKKVYGVGPRAYRDAGSESPLAKGR
ncbi:AraC family transcriptional regulator [Pseudomonas sp. M47T1]|uniref:AraC family transcriptional regulator n=1 Tax=Pseudomonas sp. M47T1 TaxID=1179778 RepID=UPI0002FEB8E4|nr:AraC family transcriptional regulator [Pseudomonas sp. M47T1]